MDDLIRRSDAIRIASGYCHWSNIPAELAKLPPVNQKPCGMTAEEYRKRMIQAFHNADCDELISVCVLPTEKEFENLEWLLKNHYKKEPCEDAISRKQALDAFGLSEKTRKYGGDHSGYDPMMLYEIQDVIEGLPSVSTEKTGRWIPVSEMLPEKYGEYLVTWTTSQSKRPFIGISEGEITGEFDHEHSRFKFEWLLEDYIKIYPDVKVTAWMPLPQPYKAESEDCN